MTAFPLGFDRFTKNVSFGSGVLSPFTLTVMNPFFLGKPFGKKRVPEVDT